MNPLKGEIASGLALIIGLCTPAHAQESRRADTMRAIRDRLPKYDEIRVDVPKVSAPPVTEPAAQTSDPVQPVAAGVEPLAATTTEQKQNGTPVELDTMTITSTRLLEHKTVVTLIPVPRLQKDVNVDPFLTGAARDEALIKKHLSPLDYAVLNRFYLPLLGQSIEVRARQAEEALHWTLQLNEFADQMSVMKAAGTSEEELKKLKEEYYKLYMMRPK
jgi:hypothetical protein